MRVLLVVHGYPPWGNGGTEIYVHDLARALVAHCGDEVSVLTREADADRPELALRREERDGVRLVVLNNTFRDCHSFEETYRNGRIREISAGLLDEIAPDVCHVQHLTGLSTDLVLEAALRKMPTVMTLNDYWLLCQRGQLLDLDLARCDGPRPAGCARCLHTTHRSAARRLDHVEEIAAHVSRFLAPSATLRQRFLAHGWEASRLTLAHQGVDHAPFRGLTRTASDRLCLGFVGSLMASKAPHLLLEAFGGLAPNAASVDLYGPHAPYHGDDRYRDRLEPLLALPGVRHVGAVPHERIPAALAALDVLVVPSIWIENAPFVIKEAFLAGVPVVASDLGGMAELVEHERSGLLFQVGDVDDLRRALERLITEPGLLDRLRAGIPPVKTIEEDAEATHERYGDTIRIS